MCVVVVLTTADPVVHVIELDKQFVVKKQFVVFHYIVRKNPFVIYHTLLSHTINYR